MVDQSLSFAQMANVPLMEDLYVKFKQDPSSVDASWRYFFEGMEFSCHIPKDSKKKIESCDFKAYLLIEAYRMYGHIAAHVDPIAVKEENEIEKLSIRSYGIVQNDLSKEFPTFGFLSKDKAPLSEIIDALKKTYSDRVGIEYMGCVGPSLELYVQKIIEPYFPVRLSRDERLMILEQLNKAELFETFIHTKYVGQKRFSLEGAETLIPLMAALLDHGAGLGLEEVVLGMAHRGRLNVLANILNKSYSTIFYEFEDHFSPALGQGTGDVKYHKGFVGDITTVGGKKLHITLASNPSHLESVDPVVEGRALAQQQLHHLQKDAVVPILIHGDSSVAGQGVVYETMQLSRLAGYATGGTIHIVINNQIGFTTLPSESRSTRYCTDIAHSFGAPVFHVSAEDPEMCVVVAKMAIELRQKFSCDVFIDLNCYRKYGHNEGDEPAFTQPLQYKLIRSKKSIRELFKQKLIDENILSTELALKMEEDFKKKLHDAIEMIPSHGQSHSDEDHYLVDEELKASIPPFSAGDLLHLAEKFCQMPQGFSLHPKIQRLFSDRLSSIKNTSSQKSIDWGTAEYLCFASLLTQGVHVRLSGQDCQRGTFSQRHAAWVDQNTAEKYFPLRHLSKDQASFEVLNSPLSEYAVLGFELGFSMSYSDALVLWEAQYGDFANTAQVIIDQYISSSEQKWQQTSNLTLLLPHGFEGQGPEHSSARIERYLQLCAQGNMIVANCTVPAQYFHLLRRQAFLQNKKPLVVFSPKALLRYPGCVSSFDDFVSGTFLEVIDDTAVVAPKKMILCSGKIYYDLIVEREKRNCNDVAIVRIEQLYPFPKKKIEALLQKNQQIQKFVWAQEEHENMGPWRFVAPLMKGLLDFHVDLQYAGRPCSAATAAGSYLLHKKQYQKMMDEAFS